MIAVYKWPEVVSHLLAIGADKEKKDEARAPPGTAGAAAVCAGGLRGLLRTGRVCNPTRLQPAKGSLSRTRFSPAAAAERGLRPGALPLTPPRPSFRREGIRPSSKRHQHQTRMGSREW